jgi:hypothetical protein
MNIANLRNFELLQNSLANISISACKNITEYCILFTNSTNSSNRIGNTSSSSNSSSSTPKISHVDQLCGTNLDVNNAKMTKLQARYAQE